MLLNKLFGTLLYLHFVSLDLRQDLYRFTEVRLGLGVGQPFLSFDMLSCICTIIEYDFRMFRSQFYLKNTPLGQSFVITRVQISIVEGATTKVLFVCR